MRTGAPTVERPPFREVIDDIAFLDERTLKDAERPWAAFRVATAPGEEVEITVGGRSGPVRTTRPVSLEAVRAHLPAGRESPR